MIDGKLESTTENPRGFGGTPDPEPEVNEAGEELPTEEEQMDYDLLTIRGRKMIFGKGKEKILKLLGTAETPAQGIGQAGSMIIKSLMASSKQSGREIDGNTAMHAATEIATDLNDLAKKNGVFQYDSPEDEQQELEDAMLWGAKYYGDGALSTGEITPEWQAMAQKQMDEGIAEEVAKAPKPKEDKLGSAVKKGIVESSMGGM